MTVPNAKGISFANPHDLECVHYLGRVAHGAVMSPCGVIMTRNFNGWVNRVTANVAPTILGVSYTLVAQLVTCPQCKEWLAAQGGKVPPVLADLGGDGDRPLFLYSCLPMLPVEDTADAAAVRSVYTRGFYDSISFAAGSSLVMQQVLRLTEEIGEYDQAAGNPAYSSKAALEELADCRIVLAQIAWLTGYPAGNVRRLAGYALHAPQTLGEMLGQLARQLRKAPAGKYDQVWEVITTFYARLYKEAVDLGVSPRDFDKAVYVKLEQDESRGYQHTGKPAPGSQG